LLTLATNHLYPSQIQFLPVSCLSQNGAAAGLGLWRGKIYRVRVKGAIDGNVKLALSYVVKASVYDHVVDAGANVVFDPATQSLVIPGREAPLKLGYALRREVLRVGTYGKNEAACVIEQPDAQNHVLSDATLSQQREFIADYLNRCDIRLESQRHLVSFPVSRRKQIEEHRRAEEIRTARFYGCK
jgi:hypothetical protein